MPGPGREKKPMKAHVLITLSLLLVAVSTGVRAADRMRFWNLTGTAIAKLYLAPSGTTKWGANQCANDPDGKVDSDERLQLTGVAAGHYDVKLTDAAGRTCIVKDVAVVAGKAYAFSLSESDLKDCSK
jgi:hypothetical protein